MQTWPVQHGKARFDELLKKCLTGGPQMVTKRGAEVAVLVLVEEGRQLQVSAGLTLNALLSSDHARADIPVPARGQARRRGPFDPR